MIKPPKDAIVWVAVACIFLLTAFTTLLYNPLHQLVDSLKLIPIILVLSFFTSTFTYTFMSDKVEKKENLVKNNMELVMKFLSQDERKVVERLLNEEGGVTQSEITRLFNENKLKSHRVVKKLISKEIVSSQRFGKTNLLKLNSDIRQSLLG